MILKLADFVKSLKENQSFQEQQYSSVVYSSIVNLLADTGANEIKPLLYYSNQQVCRENQVISWRTEFI